MRDLSAYLFTDLMQYTLYCQQNASKSALNANLSVRIGERDTKLKMLKVGSKV